MSKTYTVRELSKKFHYGIQKIRPILCRAELQKYLTIVATSKRRAMALKEEGLEEFKKWL